MLDKKIIYRDPAEKEISAIVDLTEKPETSSKPKTGNFKGRHIQQLDENVANNTAKKLDLISKKAEGNK